MMDKKESVLQKILHALFGTKTKKIFGLVIAAVLLISSGVLVYLSSMVKDDAPVDNKDILALKEESTAVDEQVVEELQEEEILEGENLFNEIWAEETDGEVMPEESDGPLATKDNETGNNGSSDDDDSPLQQHRRLPPKRQKIHIRFMFPRIPIPLPFLGWMKMGNTQKLSVNSRQVSAEVLRRPEQVLSRSPVNSVGMHGARQVIRLMQQSIPAAFISMGRFIPKRILIP